MRAFIKKRLRHMYSSVNTEKFIRTPILKNFYEWLFWLSQGSKRGEIDCLYCKTSKLKADLEQCINITTNRFPLCLCFENPNSVGWQNKNYWINSDKEYLSRSSEAVILRCSEKFRKFSRKTPALESLFKSCRPNFIEKRHRCFRVKSAEILRTHFFTEHLRWLLLAHE